MKKILLISEQYPVPENSGTNQRTMFFARCFSEYASVDLVYSDGQTNGNTVEDIFHNKFHIAKGKLSLSHFEQFRLLLEGIPWCIQSKYSRDYKNRLLSLVDEKQYDLILIRYFFNAQYFIALPDKIRNKVIIDADDVLSGPLYPLLYKISTKYSWKEWLDYKLLKHYEEMCVNYMGKTLFCSKEDIKRVHPQKPSFYKKTFIVPNIVNPVPFKEYDFCDGYSLGNTLLFIGTLNYKPNVEGLEWFLKNVFILFKSKFNNAKLLVVGKNSNETILKLCKMEGIELYTNVPDVRPYYAMSRAVIVPILKGGGTRIKILEATLADRPVLATPMGAEGLGFENGKEILLFSNPDSFISQYQLLQKREFYADIIRAARKKTTAEYSPIKFKESMEKVLDSAL